MCGERGCRGTKRDDWKQDDTIIESAFKSQVNVLEVNYAGLL